jgi:hypothetical protein
MSPAMCPNCLSAGPLSLRIQSGVVTYYRCPKCQHVWTMLKNDPNAPPATVTTPANLEGK